jgi:hypothetical protein
MTSSLEYHISVRHLTPASLALFSLLTLPLILVSAGPAQVNGAPASVTSPGFGGHAVNGTAPSVTSLGSRGYAPGSSVNFSTTAPHHSGTGDGEHRRHHPEYTAPSVVYAVPYAVDSNAANDDANPDDSDANYQGGPTIFDRRGSGSASYIPPVEGIPSPHAVQDADAGPVDPDPPLPATLLVFKGGRKLEVGNYAIQGPTLFDLTPGHARKVALADLDLEATQKQNDDRGVVFQLPPSAQAN